MVAVSLTSAENAAIQQKIAQVGEVVLAGLKGPARLRAERNAPSLE